MSLQLFLAKKTIGFCGICGSSEVTDCQVVTYHFPKLFMVDISNIQFQKDSAINQLDDELSMFGLQLKLFGVIYYDTKREHLNYSFLLLFMIDFILSPSTHQRQPVPRFPRPMLARSLSDTG